MAMQRRTALSAIGLLPLLGRGAAAQAEWQPARPIRLIAPFAPGGTSDLVARAIQGPLGTALGQPVVVENRAGAGGVLGSEALARAPADGHTLLVMNSGHAANATLIERLPFHPINDFLPLSLLARSSLILAVPEASSVRDVAALLAVARTERRPLTYGSAGNGQTNHLVGEMLRLASGIEMTHVPYRGGGPLLQDLLGARLDCAFVTPASALSQVRGGTLRALAVSGPRRMAALPDTPTMSESGWPTVQMEDWWGLVGPAGLPDAVAVRLETEARRLPAHPEVAGRLTAQGMEPAASGRAEMQAALTADVARFGRLIRDANIRPD